METKEIIEGNKLIVEFMGLKLIDPKDITETTDCREFVVWPRYHKEWNWLIPVVEKISEVCKENQKAHFYWNDHDDIRIFRESKDRTWELCVQFIKWFNDHK